jgi:type I restriction enzyme S subunit
MRQGWECKKLVEVCDLKSGTTIDSKLERPEGEIIYAKVGDMNLVGNEYFINISSRYVDFDSINQNQIIPVGAIIFPKRGGAIATNKKRRIIKPTIVDLNTMALVPSKIIDKDYLYYWFEQIDLTQLSNGTSIPQINNYSFDNVILSYPKSLNEQQSIVAILDEAFAGINRAKEIAEQNLRNAREVFDSYLQRVFESKIHGNKFDTLDDLCELIVDCEHKTAPTQETGYPSIRTPNIGKGDLILDNVNRVSFETYVKWTSRAVPKAGDLILAREAPAGNIAVIPDNIEVCLGQRTVLLRTKRDKLIPRFLAYLILSKDVQQILLSHSTGATVQHVNMKDIRAFRIYDLTSLTEQQTIVRQLDALREETKKLETHYQQKLLNLEELKKCVLQKAFNGELN